MKKFGVNFLIFAVLLACCLAAFILVTVLSFKSINNMSFRVDADTVIVGHSMPECAVDDSLLSGVLNWSSSGEGHYISYYKIRRLLERNPNIRYVVCSFSPWGDEDVVRLDKDYCYGLGCILPFLRLSDFKDLPRIRVLAWEKALRDYWTLWMTKPFGAVQLSAWGHYLGRKQCNVDKDRRYAEKVVCDQKTFKPTRHIRLIQQVCAAHGAKLILLQTPVYDKSRWFADVSWIHAKYFSDIEYWDFGSLELPKECFSDINHLNETGAHAFTKRFESKLTDLRSAAK